MFAHASYTYLRCFDYLHVCIDKACRSPLMTSTQDVNTSYCDESVSKVQLYERRRTRYLKLVMNYYVIGVRVYKVFRSDILFMWSVTDQ